MEPDGKRSWTYPASTRDGYVLSEDRILLMLSKSRKHRGGAAIVVDPNPVKKRWQLTNDDLPTDWLHDPCGGQVLSNGNGVIVSYAADRHDPMAPKLFEVNRDKQVVWKYVDDY